jgi:hypothetical protein
MLMKGKEHFFNAEEVSTLLDLYRVAYECEDGFGRAEGAAIQYYLVEFLYLPCSLVGELFGRRRWHVNQTITRMKDAADESRVPVTMNEAYRDYIENMDDLSRENFGAKNRELSMVLDAKDRAYLQWSAQKACGWFDEVDNEPDQVELVDELLITLGLPRGGWMAKVILENYKLDIHD